MVNSIAQALVAAQKIKIINTDPASLADIGKVMVQFNLPSTYSVPKWVSTMENGGSDDEHIDGDQVVESTHGVSLVSILRGLTNAEYGLVSVSKTERLNRDKHGKYTALRFIFASDEEVDAAVGKLFTRIADGYTYKTRIYRNHRGNGDEISVNCGGGRALLGERPAHLLRVIWKSGVPLIKLVDNN